MKEKKKSRLQIAQEKTQAAINKTNDTIAELGVHTNDLFIALNDIQESFDLIRNVPSDKKLQYDEVKAVRLNWKQEVDKIDNDFKNATAKNVGAGAAGTGVGVAVVTMGPTVAMGVATTFGVASTGTAISTLSGAAATNAALAWLGGGALATGGGGMAAGEAFLALAGPIGWAIAGVSLVASGLMFWKVKNEQKQLETLFTNISNRDIKKYELAIVELNERISRIVDESNKLTIAIEKIKTFGLDYTKMSEAQQYELGAYVNLMSSSTQLLVNPIVGLQANYTDDDYKKLLASAGLTSIESTHQFLVVSLCNLLYKIDFDETDKKLLYKALKGNKEFLKSLGISKRDFSISDMDKVNSALQYKYNRETTA